MYKIADFFSSKNCTTENERIYETMKLKSGNKKVLISDLPKVDFLNFQLHKSFQIK